MATLLLALLLIVVLLCVFLFTRTFNEAVATIIKLTAEELIEPQDIASSTVAVIADHISENNPADVDSAREIYEICVAMVEKIDASPAVPTTYGGLIAVKINPDIATTMMQH